MKKTIAFLLYSLWSILVFSAVYYLNFICLIFIFKLSLFWEILAVFLLFWIVFSFLIRLLGELLIAPFIFFKHVQKSFKYPLYLIGVWFASALIYATWSNGFGNLHWLEKGVATVNAMLFAYFLYMMGKSIKTITNEYSKD